MVLLLFEFLKTLIPAGIPSSINTKSFQPFVALYLSLVPMGIYSVALSKVFGVKVLLYDDLPSILNGFSISEITVAISQPLKALLPILVTPLPMVTEVSLEQL